jgi:hypothetical protein
VAGRAFIVRPFGEKKFGKDQVVVNFDDVEKDLIEPALRDLNIEGRTTAEILESGNIRNDMFQRLLVSDLVIADLTVHNANVFYELGIRHALRDKRTFLIYSRIGDEKLPFDLQTDRYLAYDHKEPKKSLPAFVAGLRRTLASDDKDSPIFRLLPALRSQDPGRFMVVPRDFREEVEQAENQKSAGLLALMAAEVTGLLWEREGLRLCARAQCRSNFLHAGRDTWTRVLRLDETDWEANLELGSLHQRLGDLPQSDLALKGVLQSPAAEPKHRAEAHALRGRNAVEYWRRYVADAPVADKQRQALLSSRLEDSYYEFQQAFEEDLRCYGFGIEALGRLIIWTTLADRWKKVWEEAIHDTPEKATSHRATLSSEQTRLIAAVELSLGIREKQPSATTDIDLRIGRAQLTLLTSKKSERVRTAYQGVKDIATPADLDDLRRFLRGFDDIDVLADNVAAASEVVADKSAPQAANPRVLLYRGYGRGLLSRQGAMKSWIRAKIDAEVGKSGAANLLGIAAGCCGGDILFHEICQELKIPSSMHLPFTTEQFIPQFVQCEDPQWIDRFRVLATALPVFVLQPSPEMAKWLKDRDAYTFVHRWNSWMLSVARSTAADVTLIALCDESQADTEGVADLVQKAKQTGVKPIVVNPATFPEGQ